MFRQLVLGSAALAKLEAPLLIFAAVAGLTVSAQPTLANGTFRDEFKSSNPSDPDRDPVTWNPFWPNNEISVSDGNLLVKDTEGGVGAAVLSGYLSQNASFETQFRISSGTNAGILVGREDPNFSYGGNTTTANNPRFSTGGALIQGTDLLSQYEGVGVDPSVDDVTMRLQVVGNQMSLWVWPAGQPTPDEPLVSAAKPDVPIDGVALFVDDVGSGTKSVAEFRYFDAVAIPDESFDCNSDGVVTAIDLQCVDTLEKRDVTLAVVRSLPGDLDGDGTVDFEDFLTLSNNFGQDGSYVEGNIDLVNGIEFADFLFLSANFGRTPEVAAASVPEPSSSLTAFLVISLLSLIRRNYKAQLFQETY